MTGNVHVGVSGQAFKNFLQQCEVVSKEKNKLKCVEVYYYVIIRTKRSQSVNMISTHIKYVHKIATAKVILVQFPDPIRGG